jgi:hypothetical protein
VPGLAIQGGRLVRALIVVGSSASRSATWMVLCLSSLLNCRSRGQLMRATGRPSVWRLLSPYRVRFRALLPVRGCEILESTAGLTALRRFADRKYYAFGFAGVPPAAAQAGWHARWSNTERRL